MAEKEEKGKPSQKAFNPDDRFRYLGFDIKPGKIGDLFKSDSEKESWVKRVIERRRKGVRTREHNTLEEPRVASYERVVLTITSLVLIASLFLPWFSGYHETVVETEVVPTEEVAAIPDSLAEMLMADSSAADSLTAAVVEETADAGADAAVTANGRTVLEKDEAGFASITSHRKKKEVVRENMSLSAVGAIGALGSIGGMVFSSGFAVMLTGILMIVYMLICIALAVYTLYSLYGAKGDEDTKAIKLKSVLRLGWIPVIIYVGGIFLSLFGGTYSFDTVDMIAQIGTSYGTSTYLGLLSSGFYISLACFVISGAKSVEI
ncbi:MAG: hypothetical protein JW763_04060 [candidate division Zixibacteria bacterium]|nr:hypothetical protein [candidate division Zixibacteria bacterium]